MSSKHPGSGGVPGGSAPNPESESAIGLLRPLLAALAAELAPRVAEALAARQEAQRVVLEEPGGLVSKAVAAKALSVSVPTLDRMVRMGAPVHVVGARRRFIIQELRAWAQARGKKTTALPPMRSVADRELDDEVEAIAAAAGLRPPAPPAGAH